MKRKVNTLPGFLKLEHDKVLRRKSFFNRRNGYIRTQKVISDKIETSGLLNPA